MWSFSSISNENNHDTVLIVHEIQNDRIARTKVVPGTGRKVDTKLPPSKFNNQLVPLVSSVSLVEDQYILSKLSYILVLYLLKL